MHGATIKNIFIVQFSSGSFSFLPLRPKYLPEHPTLKHIPPTCLLKPVSTHAVNKENPRQVHRTVL